MVTALRLDRPLTIDDLEELPDDGSRYELIWGEAYSSPAPSIRHQRVSRELVKHLDAHLTREQTGEVLAAPLDVRFDRFNVVQPDIVVVGSAIADIITDERVAGAPSICIEILSPGSRGQDNVKKRMLYANFGVPEYWIVDPEGPSITVLSLEGGVYVERLPGAGVATSAVIPGLTIDPSTLAVSGS
ncbi:MAG: Uma2 family endonuclease [Thermomicrobiales bacterium]|nr:Uma2 family endonuclease [Thermomicrobiales bacterium]